MAKVVVIGGSGFLGSHVADELSAAGHDVVVFDKCLPKQKDVSWKFIQGSVFDNEQLKSLLGGVDAVYHFASLADIGEAKLNPVDTMELNVGGVTNVLDCAVEAKVGKFVLASTMYVYSRGGGFYAASKKCAEIIVKAYHDEYGLDFVFLRYGSLYGPRAQDWNGVQKYVTAIHKNKKITYLGDGSERREYIHIVDAAKMSTKVLEGQYNNSAVTITGNQVLTSEELLHMIFEICGTKPNIVWKEPDPMDNERYKITPYAFTPIPSMKIVPQSFVDIGEGIYELVRDLAENRNV